MGLRSAFSHRSNGMAELAQTKDGSLERSSEERRRQTDPVASGGCETGITESAPGDSDSHCALRGQRYESKGCGVMS